MVHLSSGQEAFIRYDWFTAIRINESEPRIGRGKILSSILVKLSRRCQKGNGEISDK